jgi:hypothetical protein
VTSTGERGGQALVDRIDTDHRLLLRAVLLEGDEARAAFQEWRARVDIDLVDASSQRLLPFLARRLGEIAPEDPLRGLVKGIYRHAWVKNQRLWREAAAVVDALERAGIRTLLLKGAALLDAYGDDWGARPMYDVDVLVPADRAEAAIELVAGRGWVPEQDQSASWVQWRARPRRQGWGFTLGEGRLDLHWHVYSESIGARADEQFWARSRVVDLAGTPARVLDPADLLVHLLLHGTVSANAPVVQWVADSAMVLRQAGVNREFAAAVAATARHQAEVTSVARALDAIGLLLEPSLVAPVLTAVGAARPTVVERLRRPGPRWEPARQLARHAAGGEGLVSGALELATERLDLGLSKNRAATVAYVATLRSPTVAARWRDRFGSFVRTPLGPAAPPVTATDPLDFAQPAVLDAYGAIGWGRTDERGATMRGGEARLVLPLGDGLLHGDLEVSIELEALHDDLDVIVLANESEIARAHVDANGTTLRARIPAPVIARYRVLEVACRAAGFPPTSVRLRLRRLGLTAVDAL